MIPVAGGPAAEFFNLVIAPPLEKRRDEQMQSIAEGLKVLEEKFEGFSVESLQHNEQFVTAVMHATPIAIRNHQKEKLEALQNAVLNVAAGTAPEEDLQLVFLNFIDTLTPTHLLTLRLLQDHKRRYHVKLFKDDIKVVRDALGPLDIEREFLDLIIRNLTACGLIDMEHLHSARSERAAWIQGKLTTDMGDQFIAFISSPLD